MGPDLHDSALRSAADGNALSIVGPVLFGYDVLQNWELVIVHVEEVIFFILVVVEVDDAKVVRRALIIPMSSIVQVIAVCLPVLPVVTVLWLLIEVIVIRRITPSILIKMPFENQEVAFVVF